MTDLEPAGQDEAPETEESRLKRFDRRIEEWLASLKDEAQERSPEVLSAMATRAKDVAQFLEKMAEQARSKKEVTQDDEVPLPTEDVSTRENQSQRHTPDRLGE